MATRNYNIFNTDKILKMANKLQKESHNILNSQLNEDTPEADKEEIIRLLVGITDHLKVLSKMIINKRKEDDEYV